MSGNQGDEFDLSAPVETGAGQADAVAAPKPLALEKPDELVERPGVEGGGMESEEGPGDEGGDLTVDGVMRLHLLALRKQLQAGKPLSEAQMRLLQNGGKPVAVEGGVWARTQEELAEALGCTRKSIGRYLQVEGNPGRTADGRYDLKAWRAWVGARGTLKTPGDEREKLDLEVLQIEAETKRLKLAEVRGEMVSLEEAMQVLGGILSDSARKLRALKHNLAPRLVGLDPEEAMLAMDKAIVGVLAEVSVPGQSKKKAFWRSIAEQLSSLQGSLLFGSGASVTS